MARKKRVLYRFAEIYRQDKLDDWIFAYFTGVRRAIPTAKLKTIALNFQQSFDLTEDDLALDIILASYHRSLNKYLKHTGIEDEIIEPEMDLNK